MSHVHVHVHVMSHVTLQQPMLALQCCSVLCVLTAGAQRAAGDGGGAAGRGVVGARARHQWQVARDRRRWLGRRAGDRTVEHTAAAAGAHTPYYLLLPTTY